MQPDVSALWVYLSASPLLHLTVTLVAFQLATRVARRFDMNPLLNPVMLAVAAVIAVLLATGTAYDTYFEGAQFVHFLLGPATVALALPLYRQISVVRRSAFALTVSLLLGSLTASLSAMGLVYVFGGMPQTIASIAPKSVTAPVAMGISEALGGLPALTAVLVIATGIIGAMLGPPVLNALGVRDWAARGLAMGTASHGIGTARALQVNEVAGAFAGLAMGLNGVATALLLPILWRLFM